MRKKLQDKLYKKYPKIFRQKDLPASQTCMCWGISCGCGWYWLIDMLCENIQGYIDRNNKPQVEAVQVKQKFGGLRFYVHSSDDNIEGMIGLAESMSYHICEICGSTGEDVKPTKGGYVQTLCEKCKKKKLG